MPPKLPKPVPWHSPAEFIQVYEWFYPPLSEDGTVNIQAQECALRRIRAWEARGKLPHAIDSTASFVQVVVRDWTLNLTDQELRLMYSMVFIRFVNGYVDAFQSSKSAKSIAYLAVEKVGMPVWFVELRHTATHDYLPSLAILRSATQQALAWINQNYWNPQLVSVRLDERPSEKMKSAMSDDVRQMIEYYRSSKEKQIEENSLMLPKQEHVVISRLVRDLIKRCGSGDDLLETLVPILLEPGMLVSKTKKMRASVRDLNLDSSARMVDHCWMPLMNRLHQDVSLMSSTKDGETLSFWVSLVNGMLDKLIEVNGPATPTSAPKTGSYHITILAWIKHLLKRHYESIRTTPTKRSATRGTSSSSSPSSSTPGTPSLSNLSVSTPRLSVAAIAAQLVSEQAVAASQQTVLMFDNDDIINIVEDCLENSLTNVSPLLRSVLNTIIESDAEIKERIGPILKQIDQRLVSGVPSSITNPTSTSGSGSGNTPLVPEPISSIASSSSISPSENLLSTVDVDGEEEDDDVMPAVENGSVNVDVDVDMADRDTENTNQSTDGHIVSEAGTTTDTWTLFDAESWRPCPIGCLPGGILPDLSLPWDLDNPPIARFDLTGY
ncbi:rRNA-processing protein las1 [Podila epigama]|nr:rRNA-processing protein las1 [Podila epigama]